MSSSSTSAGDPAVVHRSRFGYEETVRQLSAAIVASGSRVFATIDQRAAARDAALELRPTTLLVFGNPKGGTPLMAAAPLFALELPLKLLVWESEGDVFVAYAPASQAAHRYGVTGFDQQLAAMDRALDRLALSIA